MSNAITFDEAVDIMYGITVPKNVEDIVIDTKDGKKITVRAEVRGKLALYHSNRNWYLIHTLTGIILLKSRKYEDVEALRNEILTRKIDMIFTKRDLNVVSNILNLFRVRQSHIKQLELNAHELKAM